MNFESEHKKIEVVDHKKEPTHTIIENHHQGSKPGDHVESKKNLSTLQKKVSIFLLTTQIVALVLYGTVATYADDVDPSIAASSSVYNYYPMFQDVHVMIFVGFGFLMTFLKYHCWSSVMFNFLVAAWAIEWGMLCIGFFHNCFDTSHDYWTKVKLDVVMLIEGDFAAGCVLISFGAVLGKVNSLQLLFFATAEIIFYSLNVGLCQKTFHAVDMGGSMLVHTFGALFGFGMSWAYGPKKAKENPNISANYNSSMFASIGCIFLWMFWPSFNGALASGNAQHRVVVNTVLALCSSAIGAFLMSAAMNKGQFRMEDTLNATLAGGVMIGSSTDLVAAPYAAVLIGFLAGIISVFGFNKINEFLYEKLGVHDTCGVLYLHGIPGFLGGFIGAISSRLASDSVYGDSLTDIFPELANGRSKSDQCGFQFACLFSSTLIALLSGLLVGFIIKLPFFEPHKLEDCYDDEMMWVMEPEEVPMDKKLTKAHLD